MWQNDRLGAMNSRFLSLHAKLHLLPLNPKKVEFDACLLSLIPPLLIPHMYTTYSKVFHVQSTKVRERRTTEFGTYIIRHKRHCRGVVLTAIRTFLARTSITFGLHLLYSGLVITQTAIRKWNGAGFQGMHIWATRRNILNMYIIYSLKANGLTAYECT